MIKLIYFCSAFLALTFNVEITHAGKIDNDHVNFEELSYSKHKKNRIIKDQISNDIELSFHKTFLIPSAAFALDRLCFHPLDNLLSHQQITSRKIYTTFIDIVKSDGVASLYAGFWKPFLVFGPARISMLSSYYNLKMTLIESDLTFNTSIFTSSIIAGFLDATLTCPAEVSRICATFKQPHPAVLKDYFKGYHALLIRSLVGAPIILAGSDWLIEHDSLPSTINSPFYAGLCTGFISQFFTCPIDVWKNYIMADEKITPTYYYINKIINEKSYYRGLHTKILRMSLGSGLVIGTMHNLINFFPNVNM